MRHVAVALFRCTLCIQLREKIGCLHIYRLVTDRETGRQKGFGFCEYYDKDTAQSAIRNLAGHEVNGRHLRVDCTDASNEKGDRSTLPSHIAIRTFVAISILS